MSKFEEKMTNVSNKLTEMGVAYDEPLLRAVLKGLGPSLYNSDSGYVSSSNKKELATVKNSFLIKKLGLEDSPELDEAIDSVVEQMGRSNSKKHRGIFYYLLAKHFKKEGVYGL